MEEQRAAPPGDGASAAGVGTGFLPLDESQLPLFVFDDDGGDGGEPLDLATCAGQTVRGRQQAVAEAEGKMAWDNESDYGEHAAAPLL